MEKSVMHVVTYQDEEIAVTGIFSQDDIKNMFKNNRNVNKIVVDAVEYSRIGHDRVALEYHYIIIAYFDL